MGRLSVKISSWFQCVSAGTAVEYVFIAGGIALAICIAVYFTGDELQSVFEALATPKEDIVAAVEDGAVSN
jgi:Flp pilus assembly pilin Flp